VSISETDVNRFIEVFSQLEKEYISIPRESLFLTLRETYGMSRIKTVQVLFSLMRDERIYCPHPGYYKRIKTCTPKTKINPYLPTIIFQQTSLDSFER
jgi:hypothetical protein